MNTDSLRALLARLKGSRVAQLAVLLVVVLLGGGTLSLVIDDDGPGPAPPHTVKILTATVDSADAGRAPDVALKAPATVVAAQANTLEQGLHAEDPTDANVEAQDKAAHDDQLPIVSADAAPSQRGCLSRFVQNYSSRRGVAPRLLVLHETVSPDRVGWTDVNAIGIQFNTVSSQASSTYTLDREAHCLYLVRESDKPWTQASANPWSISFEIINLANARLRPQPDRRARPQAAAWHPERRVEALGHPPAGGRDVRVSADTRRDHRSLFAGAVRRRPRRCDAVPEVHRADHQRRAAAL
jgi:hypothetical protein